MLRRCAPRNDRQNKFIFPFRSFRAPPAPNTFVGGDLLFYNHIGGYITTPEESAKYLELAKQYFKAKPFAAK